ncbi:protein kinase [Myxococcota bacterium]
MADELTGTRVGNYEIVRLLGRGGMGAVYLARHPMLRREVAIKVLNQALSHDQEALGRFRREALAVSQIGHPALVEVTDFGKLEDGRSYCIMAALRGQSLEDYLQQHGALPLADTVAIMLPVIEALGAAHAAGIVHRDIKPDNIFLDTGPRGERVPRILDFGIAKLLDPADDSGAITQTGQLLGTPLYMSPEQAGGEIKKIGPWSDVYSIGVVIYRMLTGQPPFVGESFGAILVQHMQSPPPSIRAVRQDLPEAVDALLQRAMAKEPAHRHGSMTELGPALCTAAGYQASIPTHSAPPQSGMMPAAISGPVAVVATPSPGLARTVTPADSQEVPTVPSPREDQGLLPTVTPADLYQPPQRAESSLSLAAAQQVWQASSSIPPKPRARLWIFGVLAAVVAAGGSIGVYLVTRTSKNPPPAMKVEKTPGDFPKAKEQSVAPQQMVVTQLTVLRATASSDLGKYKRWRFWAQSLIDGDLTTSWQPKGGDARDCLGEWFKLEFAKEVEISRIDVANGFQIYTGRNRTDQFFQNSRIKQCTIQFSRGNSVVATFPENQKGFTKITFSPRRSSWVKVRIDSVHRGRNYRDVAVSEVKVYGKE